MIPIIQKRKISFIASGILFITSVVLLSTFGLKLGIDFTGGTLIQLRFAGERPALQEMQETVDSLAFGSVLVQPADEDSYILKLQFIGEDDHQLLLTSVRDAFQTEESQVFEDSIETIGPSISSDLRSRSIKAGIGVIVAIILFVAYAFRKVSRPVSSWKFGVTAIIALLHDVIITMGVFAILGKYMGVEVGIPFVVAMLTILGYSVNDTIVVDGLQRVRPGAQVAANEVPMGDEDALANLSSWQSRVDNATQVTQNMAQVEDVLSGGSFATGTATAGLK